VSDCVTAYEKKPNKCSSVPGRSHHAVFAWPLCTLSATCRWLQSCATDAHDVVVHLIECVPLCLTSLFWIIAVPNAWVIAVSNSSLYCILVFQGMADSYVDCRIIFCVFFQVLFCHWMLVSYANTDLDDKFVMNLAKFFDCSLFNLLINIFDVWIVFVAKKLMPGTRRTCWTSVILMSESSLEMIPPWRLGRQPRAV